MSTIPINDGYWHHVGFSWSGKFGEWKLLIDGVLWAIRTVFPGRKLPSGGVLTIGRTIGSGVSFNLAGKISRLNLWSREKTGNEIEQIAKSPGSRDGNLICWSIVKHFTSGDLTVVHPSTAVFSG